MEYYNKGEPMIYFAPMEGLTGYIYRNAHNKFYPGVDKYFSPFIAANQSRSFKTKEINDILPEHNQGLVLIPQILTNKAQDFICTSKRIKQLGYNEINLNLGCPSGTVVSKNRGSGFLSTKPELDHFLYEIFSESVTDISVKTRIGKDQAEEFYELIEIFNKYPIKELIIHPRIQKDFYKNTPNLKMFQVAVNTSKNPVVYNGDLFKLNDYQKFSTDFPKVNTVMIGRGLLINPGLINEIEKGAKLDKNGLKGFHDQIYDDYKNVLFGERNVLFRMKDFWSYLILMFSNNEKYAKKIRKSERLVDYDAAVESLFLEQDIMN